MTLDWNRQQHIGLAASLVCLAVSSLQTPAAADAELIRDPHCQRGFILLAAQPGQRVAYGTIEGIEAGAKPVWDLAQWSSIHPLQPAPPRRLPDGALRHANPGKSITLGKPGSAEADIALAVNGGVEYGGRARTNGQPWVHLLLQQEIENPPTLAALTSAWLHVEARLKSSRKIDTPDYTPGLHAAQFQIFFSVQNLNRQSSGYGQYLWFGVPLYDDRDRVPKAHKTQDTGGTKMFIFTPAGSEFTPRSTHDPQWLVLDKDLLPLMREGLATAWAHGFLQDSKTLADYRIAGMNLGWEVPGLFDVELQMRNLSLRTH
jgi:hypothetical protein